MARRHEREGKRDGESPHHTAEFLRRSRSTRRRRNKRSAATRAWRAPMAARARVCEASSGGGVKGRTRGFVRCLNRDGQGRPWRAVHGRERRGVARPDSLSPCRLRGRKTTPTDGARLSAAERRGRRAPRWAGSRRSWAGGRKTGPGGNGLKGKKKKRGKGEGIGLGQNRKGERDGERRERFFFSF